MCARHALGAEKSRPEGILALVVVDPLVCNLSPEFAHCRGAAALYPVRWSGICFLAAVAASGGRIIVLSDGWGR